MLNFFRHQQHKQTNLIASYLVILAMLFKVMMPIAHASTAISGKASGFMMTICSASNIGKTNITRATVYVPVNTQAQQSPETESSNTGTQCALCYMVEESSVDNANKLPTAFHHFPQVLATPQHTTHDSEKHAATLAIRAPPLSI